jgi:FkbM family methyltransferase
VNGPLRRWITRLLAALIVVVVVFFAASLFPGGRSALGRGYVRVASAWSDHWPFARGGYIVYRLAPVMRMAGALPVRMEVGPGVVMLLEPLFDDVQRSIVLNNGVWQPGVWQSIAGGLGQGAVFFDVGAHVGYYSMKAAPLVGPTGRVIAFEPDPPTVVQLDANITVNHYSNVKVEAIACTDREQMLTLYSDQDHPAGASLSKVNAGEKGGQSSYSVRGRRIDDVVLELGLTRVDVMKVDVEGAEAFVLRGALETLKRFHPRLIVEIMPSNLAGMHTTVEDVLNVIKEAGYNSRRQVDDDDWEWTVR